MPPNDLARIRLRTITIDALDVQLLTCQAPPGLPITSPLRQAVLHRMAPDVRTRAVLCWRWECRERPFAERAALN